MKKSRTLLILSLVFAVFISAESTAQVVINEYSCSNFTTFQDNYQSYEDWIELYNTSSSPVNLSGYYLSDKPDAPMNWQIPAGITIPGNGFLKFWASGRDEVSFGSYHTSFKLTQTKEDPEYIVFSDPDGTIIDQQQLKITQREHANGRITNGGPLWGVFINPTPGTSNNTAVSYERYAEKPVMSQEGGFYPEAITVSLSTDEPDAVIRYTTDGKEPTNASPVYTVPLEVPSTRIIKAKVFSSNPEVLPGLIEYNTYFINESFSVPVVSIAGTDLIFLLNGDASYFPWGTIEYFNTNQERTTRGYGEFDKHGQDSWVHPQRSLDYKMRDECGYNYALQENLFMYSDRDEFQKIILRAAGDDNYPGIDSSAHLRDDFVETISVKSGMSLDERKSSRCVVFANGQYWGVYSIREKVNDHDYTKFYYDQDKYNLHYLMLWGYTWAEYGGQEAFDDWNALYSYIMYHNLADSANWAYVDSQFDYESLTDYMLINSFVVCSDWLNWNVGWWRGLNPEGSHRKWGYILWDEDATFGHYINYTGIPSQTPTVSPCFQENLSGGSDPEGHVQLLNKLRTNPGFEQYYVSRYADLMNSTFRPDNLLSLLDSLADVMAPEMARHFTRWGGTEFRWLANVQKIRNFITQRYDFVKTALTECYTLTGPYTIQVDVSPPGKGQVQLNSLLLRNFPWEGDYYGNIDTKLTALETDQYFRFDHWELNHTVLTDDSAKSISLRLTASDTILAVYEQRFYADSLVINEINYNSADNFDPGDWVEFYNPHGYNLDISGWVFKDEDDSHIFTFPEGTVLDPFALIVVANDADAFHTLFPDVFNYLGPMGFGLSGSGELLRLYDETGALVDTVHYDDNAPWPTEPDGNGPTLELINPGWDNALASSWKSSGDPHGSPGEYNSPNVGIPVFAEDERFVHIEIVPNPFRQTAMLKLYSNRKIENGILTLYNLTGQAVKQILNITADGTILDAGNLKTGCYLFRFEANNGTILGKGKLIVE